MGPKGIDWSDVDWSRPTKEISVEKGVTIGSVVFIRKSKGISPPPRPLKNCALGIQCIVASGLTRAEAEEMFRSGTLYDLYHYLADCIGAEAGRRSAKVRLLMALGHFEEDARHLAEEISRSAILTRALEALS